MSNPKTPKDNLSDLPFKDISPQDVIREQAYPIVATKYAMIGILTTMEDFIKSVKLKLQASVGPLNVKNVRLFFTIISRNVELAEKFLDEYENNQALVKLKEQEDLQEQRESAELDKEEPQSEETPKESVKNKKTNLN